MHYSCQALLLAALALETAIATPHLRHLHLHERSPTANDGWTSTIDWTTVKYTQWPSAQAGSGAQAKDKIQIANSPPETGPTSTPAASAPSTSAKASSGSTSSQSSSGGSGSCVDISQVWKTGDTSKQGDTAATYKGQPWTDKGVPQPVSKEKRATQAQDSDIGNIGGSVYGSNIIPLSDCNDQSHAYTIKFTNSKPNGHTMSLALWNSAGSTRVPQTGAGDNSFFFIEIPAGKSAAFAFEVNSEIAFSEANSDICQRQAGAPGDWNCVWGEVHFAPTPNDNTGIGTGAQTGYDVSKMLSGPSQPGHLLITPIVGTGASTSDTGCGFDGTKQGQNAATLNGDGCDPRSPSNPLVLHAQFGISQ